MSTLSSGATKFESPELVYGKSIEIGEAYKTFSFKNSDSTNCPIVKCSLKDAECKKNYAGTNLVIDDKAPFMISAPGKYPYGFNEKLCVQCSSKDQAITFDNVEFTQPNKCLKALASRDFDNHQTLQFNDQDIIKQFGYVFDEIF